jgi:hypothetical protein
MGVIRNDVMMTCICQRVLVTTLLVLDAVAATCGKRWCPPKTHRTGSQQQWRDAATGRNKRWCPQKALRTSSSAATQPLTTQAHGAVAKGARNNTAGAHKSCSNLRETLVHTKNAQD